ncbi:MAG: hypothetical protein ACFFCS_14815 [Candidatus Hodarchaeota archaeon]
MTESEDPVKEGNDEEKELLRDRIRKALTIPEEFDLSKNLPKTGEPSTIMRFLRLLSLWILTLSLISSFIYSIFLSAGILRDPALLDFRNVISYSLSISSLSGFFLLALASEGSDRIEEVQLIMLEKKRRMKELGLTEEEVKLAGEDFTPVEKKGKKFKLFFLIMGIIGLLVYGIIYLIFSEKLMYLAIYGLVGALVSVGFYLSGFAGELNVELWRFEIFRLHIHEAAIGIFFIIVAVPLQYTGTTIDKILGAFYFFVGAFLVGRDWKDVSAGKIIERKGK